jgi:hypothetical protein
LIITRDHARKTLGAIRLANGAMALFAPRTMAKTLGVKDANSAVIYALRMFGIRTVIIGLQLFVSEGEALDNALHVGILIHASDATAAVLAGVHHDLPPRAAVAGALISTLNTGLAVVGSTC